jgi:hypothetical protein
LQTEPARCGRRLGVGDDQLDALEAAPDQGLEEAGPEGLGLGRADLEADDLAPAVGADRDSDYRRHRDDAAALALLEVGGVEPEIGPLALQRPIEEGVDTLVDVLAQLGDLRLRDAREAHRLDQVVDAPGRDPADPGFLNDRHQGLLGHLAGLEERREVAALAQLGDAQLQGAEAGVQGPVAIAVAVVEPVDRALVPRGADQALDVGLHQQLQHRLGNGAQEVAFSGLLHELGQGHPLLGHRVLRRGRVKRDNSTLADRPDDHRGGEPAARLRQTRWRSLRRAASHHEIPPPPWTLPRRGCERRSIVSLLVV